jgi:predicted DNA-binding transcriptional regulator AlpA
MNKNDGNDADRAIRPVELQQILGISRSSIHRLSVAGSLPQKRRYPGGESTYYLLSEILAFLKNQPQSNSENK